MSAAEFELMRNVKQHGQASAVDWTRRRLWYRVAHNPHEFSKDESTEFGAHVPIREPRACLGHPQCQLRAAPPPKPAVRDELPLK